MTRFITTLLILSGAWGASSVGYFWLTPVVHADIGYNDAPVFFAVYYAVWAGFAFAMFRHVIMNFAACDTPKEHALLVVAMIAVFASYTVFVIPNLPATTWTKDETPVEFFWAGSWYFLPKSIEILFQQIMIAALILSLNALQLSLGRIAVAVAILFGGFHFSLALMYDNPFYVLRYSVAATIFGAIAPYLILRLRNGFLISYGVHWAYYAIDIALIHFYFAAN